MTIEMAIVFGALVFVSLVLAFWAGQASVWHRLRLEDEREDERRRRWREFKDFED
jgi:hypothetical protein